jgi:hypothetical protein
MRTSARSRRCALSVRRAAAALAGRNAAADCLARSPIRRSSTSGADRLAHCARRLCLWRAARIEREPKLAAAAAAVLQRSGRLVASDDQPRAAHRAVLQRRAVVAVADDVLEIADPDFGNDQAPARPVEPAAEIVLEAVGGMLSRHTGGVRPCARHRGAGIVDGDDACPRRQTLPPRSPYGSSWPSGVSC